MTATYTLSTPYFHNVTLALAGSEVQGTAGILQVNEFKYAAENILNHECQK